MKVEVALAKVQAGLGIIPPASAQEIKQVLENLNIPPEALAEDTLKNGIPVIPLLTLAKKHLTQEAQRYLHWGYLPRYCGYRTCINLPIHNCFIR